MKIGFAYKIGNPVSAAIADITSSQWSHCFLVVGPIGGDQLIAEATMLGGVKLNLLSKYQNPEHVLELVEIGDPVLPQTWPAVLPLIGDMYGFWAMVGYLLAYLFHLKENPCVDGQPVCSEYVLLFLMASSLASYFSDLDYRKVTPQDIYVRAKALNIQ